MVELITEFEPRLHRPYQQLVMEHLSPAQKIAAGLRALPVHGVAFASTQAAWRFYANQRVTRPELMTPVQIPMDLSLGYCQLLLRSKKM
ncbi:MAG: hypothetical protein M3430_22285 [Acidobacteriota bacterium]|nr:hypothetical protein [Acidobacteriota bacterium]